MRPHAIATDNYFKNREDTPRDENGQYDFEGLGAMDVEQFNRDMVRLLNGETVELPHFNFKKGAREYNGDLLTLGPQDILVIEGIHCLNDQFSHALPKESKYRIYISCLTTLNVDDHNRIPTTDARLLRRIERDARTRGYNARATIQLWPSVRRGEERNIFPHQDSADVIFNSALLYETALLKPYVEPLLFAVPKDCEEYIEAKRLLKFLSYFLPVPADDVPRTSLLREFIGGGCYPGEYPEAFRCLSHTDQCRSPAPACEPARGIVSSSLFVTGNTAPGGGCAGRPPAPGTPADTPDPALRR